MRFTLFGLAAIAIIGAIVVFVGPLFISTDDLRDSLFAQVESATGYRLRVSGPLQVSFFPSLDLVAEDVGIAPGGAANAAEMAKAKSLHFGLQLSALFGGKVKMTEVTMIDPVIAVPAAQKAAKADAGDGAAPQAETGSASSALKNLSLDKLVIKNGTLILPGSGGAPGKRIEALNLEASLPSTDETLSFDGSAVIDGKSIKAAGSVGGLGQFLDGEAVPVSLTIDAPSYLGEQAVLNGIATHKGDTFALSQFSAGAGDKAVTGSASYTGSILTLHPLKISAGGNALSGSVAADLSGSVPTVNAAFTGQTLDLDALLANQGAASASEGQGSAGWSGAKIDFSALDSVTAKLKLAAGQLIYHNIKISQATLQATISGGKLNATLPNFKLYQGAGALALEVDASGKTPTQRISLSLANFDAYPLLKDVAGFESLEGTGAVSLDLVSSGASQHAMVLTLSGAAKFEFTNGAIRGINIAKTVRSLSTGILSGWQANEAEKTDFATLGASFKVAQGQAQTSNLSLAGPLVRMTGAGTIDLPAHVLKFRVDPQLVASLEGQGGKTDLQGLGVPVMIAGPWARPSIYPDIEGILKDPAAAYQQLNRLGGGLVSLPGAGSTSSVSGLGGLIKDGKLGDGGLQQGALTGLGQLLGAEQPADQVPSADAAQEPASNGAATEVKKGKKRQADARAEPGTAPAAAKQFLQNFLGN